MYNLRREPPDDERIALETCTGILFNPYPANVEKRVSS